MSSGAWVSLFSGGKDSSFALYDALQDGHQVRRLLTIQAQEESYLYHVPAINITNLAAESIGIPLYKESTPSLNHQDTTDSTRRVDQEIKPLKTALRELNEELKGISGVISGAIASTFQKTRFSAVCDELGMELYAPLWNAPPQETLSAMLEAGFEIMIISVAAGGLNENWLGRILDQNAIDELAEINEQFGVHIMGEGGEYETLVIDGPHMDRRIDLTYDTHWDGTRGAIDIQSAQLT